MLFSTAAWTNTGSQYVLGNANRNYSPVRGPWYPSENLSAKKTFHVTEGTSFSLRMDYFNALNRVQAPFPTTTLGVLELRHRSQASSLPPIAGAGSSRPLTSRSNAECSMGGGNLWPPPD